MNRFKCQDCLDGRCDYHKMLTAEATQAAQDKKLEQALCDVLLGERLPLDIVKIPSPMERTMFPTMFRSYREEIIIPANKKITKTLIRKLIKNKDCYEIDPSPVRCKLQNIFAQFELKLKL